MPKIEIVYARIDIARGTILRLLDNTVPPGWFAESTFAAPWNRLPLNTELRVGTVRTGREGFEDDAVLGTTKDPLENFVLPLEFITAGRFRLVSNS